MSRAAAADIVVMAAAVADYTDGVARVAEDREEDGPLTLTLERTRDVLADLGQLPSRREHDRPLLVGFAAETHDVVAHARQKLERKNVDLIVANDVSRQAWGSTATPTR